MAQEELVRQLDLSSDEMKYDEVKTFPTQNENIVKKPKPATFNFMKKGTKTIGKQKKTRYQLAQEKKRERAMKKKKPMKSTSKFDANIRQWQDRDRTRWEALQNNAISPKLKNSFDDILVGKSPMANPRVRKQGAKLKDPSTSTPQCDTPTEPTCFDDNCSTEQKHEDFGELGQFSDEIPDEIEEENNREQVRSSNPPRSTNRLGSRAPGRTNHPKYSHHVSSLFPRQPSRPKKKLNKPNPKPNNTIRRLRQEHEEELHKLKKLIEKHENTIKRQRATLESSKNKQEILGRKLKVFEQSQGDHLTKERKEFETFKKQETRRLNKLKSNLDSKAKLILNAPTKQERRKMKEVKDQHAKQISELKSKQEKQRAHNECLRRKVQHLETEIRTLKITNERLAKANAEVLIAHTQKVLKPAFAAIAKQERKTTPGSRFAVRSASRQNIMKRVSKSSIYPSKVFRSKPANVRPQLEIMNVETPRKPSIPQIFEPHILTTQQLQSQQVQEATEPIETAHRSHWIKHVFIDGSVRKDFTTGASLTVFPDKTELIVHENGDQEKKIKAKQGYISSYAFNKENILKISFPDGKEWVHFKDSDDFHETLPHMTKKFIYKANGVILEESL